MIRDMSSDHLEYLSVLGGKMSKLIVHQTRVIVAVSECGLLLDLRLFSQQISAYFLCVVSHEKDVPVSLASLSYDQTLHAQILSSNLSLFLV